jgi:hypothetical protein
MCASRIQYEVKEMRLRNMYIIISKVEKFYFAKIHNVPV